MFHTWQSPPFLMLSDDRSLAGNNRYQGFIKDLLDHISQAAGFRLDNCKNLTLAKMDKHNFVRLGITSAKLRMENTGARETAVGRDSWAWSRERSVKVQPINGTCY